VLEIIQALSSVLGLSIISLLATAIYQKASNHGLYAALYREDSGGDEYIGSTSYLCVIANRRKNITRGKFKIRPHPDGSKIKISARSAGSRALSSFDWINFLEVDNFSIHPDERLIFYIDMSIYGHIDIFINDKSVKSAIYNKPISFDYENPNLENLIMIVETAQGRIALITLVFIFITAIILGRLLHLAFQ